MTSNWHHPANDEPVHHSRGMMKMRSVSASMEGLDVVVNRKGVLSLHLTAEFKIGEFER